MNITVSVEFNKDSIENFTDLEKICYNFALSTGREVMKQILCAMDDELAMSRDHARYRNKGLRKTCIKSILGEVEFDRRVYIDNEATTEAPKCVHLLDESLGIEKTGLFSPGVCELITKSIVNTMPCEGNDLCSNSPFSFLFMGLQCKAHQFFLKGFSVGALATKEKGG